MFTLRLLGSASLERPDGPVAGRAALRQRIALLALLAVEYPRPLSRDKLVAYLWSESGTDDARHLLRESLYILRSALGDDSVLSAGDDLRLNPARLTCDLWDFDAALARHDLEAAIDMYHGPFLSGFHLGDSEDFERWVDGERSRLARRYAQTLEQLAERQMQHGDAVRAAEWWSRLAGEDPYNSRIALRYMQALEAAGDRAGALRHAKVHSDLLRADLDAAPDREVVALAERLRLEPHPATATPASAPTSSAAPFPRTGEDPEPLPAEPVSARLPTRRRLAVPAGVILIVLVGIGVLGGKLSRARPPVLAPRRIAAAPFENRTGRLDLADLGTLAADWIIRGVLETRMVELADLQAVYAREKDESNRPADPLSQARQGGAGIMIRGSYYVSGDSVLFQAGFIDVASGRVLRSFDPVGAPLDKVMVALEELRERIAGGLIPLAGPLDKLGNPPVDPNLIPPPSLPAYREFLAGLEQGAAGEWEAEANHFRRAATLDSTFAAPLIQLAFEAVWNDECSTTDSVGAVLDRRRDRLTQWDRLTMGVLRARCQGDRSGEIRLLEKRYRAYPNSPLARGTYATWGLLSSDHARAAREILRGADLRQFPEGHAWYWEHMAAIAHTLREYRTELNISEQWRDSTEPEWLVIRGRALTALGREDEVLALLHGAPGASDESYPSQHLKIATELAVHGHAPAARVLAKSILAQFELRPDTDVSRLEAVARANRLLGSSSGERAALERIVQSDADSVMKLAAEGRIAVLMADTGRAGTIDGVLKEQSERRLRSPEVRRSLILARAHIAAGFGRRQQAVDLLRMATARTAFPLGAAHAFHHDLLLASLRGYAPFDAMLTAGN
jgi:DNA-binding SARP family transcriptional activator